MKSNNNMKFDNNLSSSKKKSIQNADEQTKDGRWMTDEATNDADKLITIAHSKSLATVN